MAAATGRTAGDRAAAGRGGTTTTQVRDILVGTLVVDIADAKKGQLAWRGMGVKEVNTQAESREAGQEHQQRVEEDLQELSAEAEDLGDTAA